MIDFNIENIRKNNIKLLDCQVDIILKSLELYLYMYGYIYPRDNQKPLTNEEELRVSLVRDTYKNINSQYVSSRKGTPLPGDIEQILQNLA